MRWFSAKHWFLPETPDLVALLVRQGEITVEAIESFSRWAAGGSAEERQLRELEHSADDARHALVAALRRAFISPIEPEDLFELSERMDAVVNQAKDLVREAEVLGMDPDRPMAAMGDLVLEATRELLVAFSAIVKEPDTATASADAAIRCQRQIERVYRQAMSALLKSNDVHEVGGRRELYRRYARLGEAIEAVADRIWYAVVKQA
jgi:uncharacterized protein Yka (UPF0111/DUF47 family)